MKAIHVIPAITEEASGPSYSVVRLCQSLLDAGNDVTLAALDWSPVSSMPAFVKVFPIGYGPRRAGRSPKMYQWLMAEASSERTHIIHSHGMWQMNAVYPGWAAKTGQAKYVVSPRGALSTWSMSHGSRFKGLFWRFIQYRALSQASCFHATAETEYHDIRRMSFGQPVAVIPNGIDIPRSEPRNRGSSRTLLFLGRIHPKKGVDVLIHAWAAIMDRFPDWSLRVVGTDRGYGAKTGYHSEMIALATTLRLKRASFLEPLYGPDKLSAYRDADLFVLPTHSENFGLTVAEALAAGTPAIVTKGAPWSGLEANQSGWWIDTGVDALVAGLTEAMSHSSEELAWRGANGREWMIREFAWEGVASRMNQTYQWLVNGGKAPCWVRTE